MKNANLVFRTLVLAVVPLLTLGACAKEKSGTTPAAVTIAAAKTVADFFPIQVGERTVRMQLAVRPDEMQRGLMERRDLARDDGMIFIYEKPQQMSFWMRNTPTPLDIGFYNSEGVLEEVYPMHPFDETSVSSRSDRLRFALEMNQGWFQANGIKPGSKLDVKALAAALKARGFDAKKYGLAF
ncbi:DUF192 domain-containing protein [Horticoccus sp. 23ND18S-11]|uniref:DUF192 domain-containing protein n=1 Tax=Horticoccus sp. 23ND18S-11 TaxID=3391832 RepID=UPI0039C9ECF1